MQPVVHGHEQLRRARYRVVELHVLGPVLGEHGHPGSGGTERAQRARHAIDAPLEAREGECPGRGDEGEIVGRAASGVGQHVIDQHGRGHAASWHRDRGTVVSDSRQQ